MNKVIAILAVLVVLGGAAAGYFWNQLKQNSHPDAEQVNIKPLFHPMSKFVMSVNGDPMSRYLVLELTLVTHKQPTLDILTEVTPILRNALVEHFAKQSHLEVKLAMQNIAEAQANLLEKFNQALIENKYTQQIDKVLITNIFIQ